VGVGKQHIALDIQQVTIISWPENNKLTIADQSNAIRVSGFFVLISCDTEFPECMLF